MEFHLWQQPVQLPLLWRGCGCSGTLFCAAVNVHIALAFPPRKENTLLLD